MIMKPCSYPNCKTLVPVDGGARCDNHQYNRSSTTKYCHLEKRLHESKLNICKFHDQKDLVNYSIEHTYEPDFTIEKDGKKFLIEVKGRFRDSAEASKYVWIRKFLQKHDKLVFIFQNTQEAFPFAKKHKDGTRHKHAELY